jgi:hypothetical protein
MAGLRILQRFHGSYLSPMISPSCGTAVFPASLHRYLCSAADTGKSRPRKKSRAPDTPFVQRRVVYLQELSKLRKRYLEETVASRTQDDAEISSKKAALEALAASRLAAKR